MSDFFSKICLWDSSLLLHLFAAQTFFLLHSIFMKYYSHPALDERLIFWVLGYDECAAMNIFVHLYRWTYVHISAGNTAKSKIAALQGMHISILAATAEWFCSVTALIYTPTSGRVWELQLHSDIWLCCFNFACRWWGLKSSTLSLVC
jgi:hypothetical protein